MFNWVKKKKRTCEQEDASWILLQKSSSCRRRETSHAYKNMQDIHKVDTWGRCNNLILKFAFIKKTKSSLETSKYTCFALYFTGTRVFSEVPLTSWSSRSLHSATRPWPRGPAAWWCPPQRSSAGCCCLQLHGRIWPGLWFCRSSPVLQPWSWSEATSESPLVEEQQRFNRTLWCNHGDFNSDLTTLTSSAWIFTQNICTGLHRKTITEVLLVHWFLLWSVCVSDRNINKHLKSTFIKPEAAAEKSRQKSQIWTGLQWLSLNVSPF